jgi:hypothetical protein
MSDVWGSSPNDVYAAGHCDDLRGDLWHFDGKNWTTVKLSNMDGGLITGSINVGGLCGQGANDIWGIGYRLFTNLSPPPNFYDSSLIVYFDGSHWREVRVSGGRMLLVIRSVANNDIWAAGHFNTLFHYDGVQWKRDTLPVNVPADTYFDINVLMPISADDVYASGYLKWDYLPNSIYYLFRRQNGQWSIVDSARIQPGLIEYKWGVGDMWMSPSGTLYSCGGGIYRQSGGQWDRIYNPSTYLYRIVGTSDDNIFVVGDYNTILHYNGTDWYQFPQFSQTLAGFHGIWTNGREVFIVGFTSDSYPQKTIVLHGK